MPKDSNKEKAANLNQYPGYFVQKRVYIKSVDGEITRGVLIEIQDYFGKKMLIVQCNGTVIRTLNLDHVTYIEELD